MMTSNIYLLIFAIAFMGCVLATPAVTRLAIWFGAIDRPDQFRRIHKGATPRMGGLGLAFGLVLGIVLVVWGGYLREWERFPEWWVSLAPVAIASLIVLLVGTVDDLRGMGPRVKLLGQAAAVIVLYMGGIRVGNVVILGLPINLESPSFTFSFFGREQTVALLGLLVTMFWFLACMNVWNLIDGMDGLASGVGLLVSGTLMLVAIHYGNSGVAFMAASLAGSLAGFLLYNWHPACIFLGDSGSLLIGLLIGVIGVQGSLKGPSAISILFPILAMGLPISDTAMAIFRRWVRNLPLSSADRRHVHHLLIGLGMNPRQAAILLYIFSGFLCGVVLLGVAFQSEFLALVLGISGCLAFLLILTSRRNELATLRADFLARMARGKQERFAAKITWEAIQRIELADNVEKIWEILEATTVSLGCDGLKVHCSRDGQTIAYSESGPALLSEGDEAGRLSGPTATFRLSSGQDQLLTVSLHQPLEASLAADIAFRFLQRLSLATAERLERLLANAVATAEGAPLVTELEPSSLPIAPAVGDPARLATSDGLHDESVESRPGFGWLRGMLGWPAAATVTPQHSLGEE
jgi:UDP-GlcNAc:undecaprenyl-phosphate GlcNAc-1-phosphate transferase